MNEFAMQTRNAAMRITTDNTFERIFGRDDEDFEIQEGSGRIRVNVDAVFEVTLVAHLIPYKQRDPDFVEKHCWIENELLERIVVVKSTILLGKAVNYPTSQGQENFFLRSPGDQLVGYNVVRLKRGDILKFRVEVQSGIADSDITSLVSFKRWG